MHIIYSQLKGFKIFNFISTGEEDYDDICSLITMSSLWKHTSGSGYEYGTSMGDGYGTGSGNNCEEEIEIHMYKINNYHALYLESKYA